MSKKDLDKVNQYTKLEDIRIEEKEEFIKVVDEMNKVDKKDLPKIIESKKKEVITSIRKYIDDNKLSKISYAKLYELMSSGNAYNRTKYSAIELHVAYEVFKSITSDLVLADARHSPSKQLFCSFIGVSTQTYSQYLLSDDLELVEVANRIDDYLTDVQLTMAQNGLLNPGATMFRMKTEHGYVEPKEIIAITNEVNFDHGRARANLDKLRDKT